MYKRQGVGDYFTKWVEAYAIPNQEVTIVPKALVYSFCSCSYGIPVEIQTDQGKHIVSGVFKEFLSTCYRKIRTTSLHPQSDGIVEGFNRSLEQHLSKIVDENQTDWDQYHCGCLLYTSRCV